MDAHDSAQELHAGDFVIERETLVCASGGQYPDTSQNVRGRLTETMQRLVKLLSEALGVMQELKSGEIRCRSETARFCATNLWRDRRPALPQAVCLGQTLTLRALFFARTIWASAPLVFLFIRC